MMSVPHSMVLATYLGVQYDDCKRIIQRIIRTGEVEYYEKLSRESRSNIIKSGKIVRAVINKRINSTKTVTVYTWHYRSTKDCPEKLNEFYLIIGPTLASQIPPCRCDPMTYIKNGTTNHDDVIKWKHYPRYWPFVRGIHRSPVNSPHKGQWRGALMFSLICTEQIAE